MQKKKIIAIVGPTATGKSDLAVALARYIHTHATTWGIAGAEIISADSRQVYQGLTIGSGKITTKEMRGVPHHLLDVVSPSHVYTVAQYQKTAHHIISHLHTKNIVPILCGGTGLYIDAVLYGYIFPAIKPNPSVRKKLEIRSTEKLYSLLLKKDPLRAAHIDRFNRRRLIRALEIIHTTKKPIPPLSHQSLYDTLILGVRMDKKMQAERIHTRLTKRMQHGMVAEVQRLHTQGVSWKRLEDLGLEYRFIARFLQKKISKQDMYAQLELHIHQFAKRQMTWFKRNKEIVWIDIPTLHKIKNNIHTFLST